MPLTKMNLMKWRDWKWVAVWTSVRWYWQWHGRFRRSRVRYHSRSGTSLWHARLRTDLKNEYFDATLSVSWKGHLSYKSRLIDDYINTFFTFMTSMTPLVFSREVINWSSSLLNDLVNEMTSPFVFSRWNSSLLNMSDTIRRSCRSTLIWINIISSFFSRSLNDERKRRTVHWFFSLSLFIVSLLLFFSLSLSLLHRSVHLSLHSHQHIKSEIDIFSLLVHL